MRKIKDKLIQIIYQQIIKTCKPGMISTFVRLTFLDLYLMFTRNTKNLGALLPRPNTVSLYAYLIGSRHNLNHLGNPFSEKIDDLSLSRKLERDVISDILSQISLRLDKFEGYVTSGGTESNIFMMWCGREKLKTKNRTAPLLIRTALSHYSLSKAARILSISEAILPISTKTWSVDVNRLRKEILKHSKKGYSTYILPLTLGYSSTGTSDDIRKVCQELKNLSIDFNIKFFVWIDAASQGLVTNAISQDTTLFSDSLIQGIVFDYHKYGQTPIPSGVVLYRKELRGLVEKPIDYLSETDATLLGSRPGASVLGVWSKIQSSIKAKEQSRFNLMLMHKDEFIVKLKYVYPKVKIITDQQSVMFAIIIDRNFPRLPSHIEEKYFLHYSKILYSTRHKPLVHYKINIIDSDFIKSSQQFIQDLSKIKSLR